jgi:hypothetical protein
MVIWTRILNDVYTGQTPRRPSLEDNSVEAPASESSSKLEAARVSHALGQNREATVLHGDDDLRGRIRGSRRSPAYRGGGQY